MALKVFAFRNKQSKEITHLIKAETKGQAQKAYTSSVEISAVDAVELLEIMENSNVRVLDAAAIIEANKEDAAGSIDPIPDTIKSLDETPAQEASAGAAGAAGTDVNAAPAANNEPTEIA